jgi:hypothetical protein
MNETQSGITENNSNSNSNSVICLLHVAGTIYHFMGTYVINVYVSYYD